MEAPGKSHGGGAVAQMPLHLSGDSRHGERHELLAALRVEALDCVQQADGARLDQVVVLCASAVVPVCEALDQRHVELDQPLPRSGIVVSRDKR